MSFPDKKIKDSNTQMTSFPSNLHLSNTTTSTSKAFNLLLAKLFI
jgi:hypothetical protein